MKRQLLGIILAATLIPTLSLADDATDAPAPTDSPQAVDSSVGSGASSTQSGASSSLLGPPASTGSTSSPADGGTLQPAGNNPLQSSTGDSSGLSAPTSSLQGAAANDSLKVTIDQDADGVAHDPSTQSNSLLVVLAGLGAGFVALALLLVALRYYVRRRFTHLYLTPEYIEPEPVANDTDTQ